MDKKQKESSLIRGFAFLNEPDPFIGRKPHDLRFGQFYFHVGGDADVLFPIHGVDRWQSHGVISCPRETMPFA